MVLQPNALAALRDVGVSTDGLGQPIGQAVIAEARIVKRGRRSIFVRGLGLAMVRKLLESQDSELQFETGAGHGTRFFFELDMPPVTRL